MNLKGSSKLLLQYVVVIVVISLMIIVGNYFASQMVSKYTETYMGKFIDVSLERLEGYLNAHALMFENICSEVETMYTKNSSSAEINDVITSWSQRINSQSENYQGFLDIYAVIDGEFMCASDWVVPDDFDPTTRLWYIGAYQLNGRTYFSDPLINAETGQWIMSNSKLLYDEDNQPFGVLSYHAFLSTVVDYLNNLQFLDSGFCGLVDSDMRFIVHPDVSLFSLRVEDINRELADAVLLLEEGTSLDAYHLVSYERVKSILFARQMFNGWYMYIMVPQTDYYRDVNTIFLVLLLAGTISSLLLCGVLTLMHLSKNRFDKLSSEAHEMSLYALKQFEMIWDNVECSIIIIDAKTREILDVNPMAAHLYGGTKEDMIGKTCWHAFCSDECPILDLNQELDRSERQFKKADGSLIPVVKSVAKIQYNGQPALLESFTDISSLKESEEQQRLREVAEQSSLAKSAFLANTSHEIRTPMNVIIGMSELLMHSSQLTERDREYVDDISTSANALLSIINDILDMSKIESGKMELWPVHYDLFALVDNVVSMFSFIASKKGIDFQYVKEGEIPRYQLGDDIKLRQILTNICGNAVKYTEEGFVYFKIALSPGGNMIVFAVEDSGMGIRKEDIPKLFYAFEQSKTDKNRRISGTGLGLAISNAFIEMMGGSIQIESDLGKGSIFTIEIPMVEGDSSQIKRDEDAQKKQSLSAPQANILLVDDNEYNLKVGRGLLHLLDIDALMVLSGKQAIEMVMQNDFDIVFMDHMMPEMDGIEATAEIRARGGKYERLTIVALTANAIYGSKEMFLDNGFNDFLPKPISMDELTKTLVTWLPPEKISWKMTTADVDAEDSDIPAVFWEALDKVSEIDVETGLMRVNGLKRMYFDILKLFSEKLQTSSKRMAELFEDNDLKNFSIAVHAAKSNLASIGAARLSDMAYKLEIESKNSNIDFCKNLFPDFLIQLKLLDEQLTEVFPRDTGKIEKEDGDANYLRQSIEEVKEAIAFFDSDMAIQILNSTLAYDYGTEVNELLESAAAALKQYKYDEAAFILSNME